MKHPPGHLAETLGVNASAVCRCGNETFYCLVKIHPDGEERLMAIQCEKCHYESPVPMTEEVGPRKFQA